MWGLCVAVFEEIRLFKLFKLLIDLFYENVVHFLSGLHKKKRNAKSVFKQNYTHCTDLIIFHLLDQIQLSIKRLGRTTIRLGL